MATLYTQQSNNVSKTWLLMAGFLAVVTALGYFGGLYYGDDTIVYIAIVIAIVMNIGSYWFADKIALKMSHAVPIDPDNNAGDLELKRTVENLAITMGLPVPRIYIINDPSPNAFATGRNKNHAAIAVTSGLLKMMNKTELEGVLAHEMSHIGNRDILLSTIVVVLVGFVTIFANIFLRTGFWGGGNRNKEGGANGIFMLIGVIFIILSPIVATIIQLAISRKREFLADATGALVTRYPDGLASALQKIEDYDRPMSTASNATAHMYFTNPFGEQAFKGLHKLFMTHPPTPERIQALIGRDHI